MMLIAPLTNVMSGICSLKSGVSVPLVEPQVNVQFLILITPCSCALICSGFTGFATWPSENSSIISVYDEFGTG